MVESIYRVDEIDRGLGGLHLVEHNIDIPYGEMKSQSKTDKKTYIEIFNGWLGPGDSSRIEQYEYVVNQTASKYCTNHPNWIDDAKGVGREALVKAGKTWDINKREYTGEDAFETWARTLVRQAVLNFLRKEELREKTTTESLDDPYFDSDNITKIGDDMDAESLLIAKERHETMCKKLTELSKNITERERFVLRVHILPDDPMTLREMAKVWGCGKSSIQRDKDRILKKLEIDDEA